MISDDGEGKTRGSNMVGRRVKWYYVEAGGNHVEADVGTAGSVPIPSVTVAVGSFVGGNGQVVGGSMEGGRAWPSPIRCSWISNQGPVVFCQCRPS